MESAAVACGGPPTRTPSKGVSQRPSFGDSPIGVDQFGTFFGEDSSTTGGARPSNSGSNFKSLGAVCVLGFDGLTKWEFQETTAEKDSNEMTRKERNRMDHLQGLSDDQIADIVASVEAQTGVIATIIQLNAGDVRPQAPLEIDLNRSSEASEESATYCIFSSSTGSKDCAGEKLRMDDCSGGEGHYYLEPDETGNAAVTIIQSNAGDVRPQDPLEIDLNRSSEASEESATYCIFSSSTGSKDCAGEKLRMDDCSGGEVCDLKPVCAWGADGASEGDCMKGGDKFLCFDPGGDNGDTRRTDEFNDEILGSNCIRVACSQYGGGGAAAAAAVESQYLGDLILSQQQVERLLDEKEILLKRFHTVLSSESTLAEQVTLIQEQFENSVHETYAANAALHAALERERNTSSKLGDAVEEITLLDEHVLTLQSKVDELRKLLRRAPKEHKDAWFCMSCDMFVPPKRQVCFRCRGTKDAPLGAEGDDRNGGKGFKEWDRGKDASLGEQEVMLREELMMEGCSRVAQWTREGADELSGTRGGDDFFACLYADY